MDSRYNRWLFEKMIGMSVLEHILNKIDKMVCDKVVVYIYNCVVDDLLIKLSVGRSDYDVLEQEIVHQFFISKLMVLVCKG